MWTGTITDERTGKKRVVAMDRGLVAVADEDISPGAALREVRECLQKARESASGDAGLDVSICPGPDSDRAGTDLVFGNGPVTELVFP